MISSLIIFLPSFICLFSTIAHLKLLSRTDARWLLFFMELAISFFLISEACLTDARASAEELSHVRLISLTTAPCIIPLAIMYLRKLRQPHFALKSVSLLWITIPAILVTASIVMYFLIGERTVISFMEEIKNAGPKALEQYKGTAEFTYYILTQIVSRVIIAGEILLMLVYVIIWTIKDHIFPGKISAFLFKGESLRVTSIQLMFLIPVIVALCLKVANLHMTLAEAPVLCILLSFILAAFISGLAFTALFGAKKEITLHEMRFANMFNYSVTNKGEIVEEMMNLLLEDAEKEALERVQRKIGENLHIEEFQSEEASPERTEVASKIFEAVDESWNEDDILGRFQRLMRDEMLFLKPGLSLEDVAEKLDTNKFYISKMVNNTFNMGFPEVVNILRIDYAEQYIINNPDAKQSEIATKCGFLSASTFNTIFKKVTGMTPKMWVAARDRDSQA